jgi:photosystem II stability/assembly factor-like uncharacterized protein
MKKNIFIVVFLFFTNLLNAQWVPGNGPWSGSVNCFTNIGTSVYAGTEGNGIYISSNNGSKWSPSSVVGLSNYNVKCFLWSGTNLYAGTEGGVFLSTNNGVSWFGVNSGLYNSNVNSLVLVGSNIFAGTTGGVFITSDNGASWYNSSYGLTDQNVNSIIVLGNGIFAGTNQGIFKSIDNGNSWSSANFGLINQYVNTLFINDNTIWAGTSYSPGAESVYKSTDYGSSWFSSGLSNLSIFSFALFSSNIYAGTGSGIYRTSDKGAAWSSELGNTKMQIKSFYVSGSNLIAGTPEAIFLSTNGGTVWDAVGYNRVYVWSLDASGPNLWATGYQHYVYLSTNNGDSWIPRINDLYPAFRYPEITSSGGNTYVTFINNNLTRTGVYKTTNDGLNWQEIVNWPNRHITSIAAGLDTMIFLGLYHKNGEYGITCFSSQFQYYSEGLYDEGVWDIAIKDTNVFAATLNGIYRSTNSGFSWVNTGIPANKLAVYGESVYAVNSGGGIYRTTDNGDNWYSIGLNDKYIQGLAVYENKVIAGVYGEGFYITTDDGTNWYPRNEGLDSIPDNITDIVIKNGVVFSSFDDASIWKRSLSDITEIKENSVEIPTIFSLSQNYPNPFNPKTVISWQLPISSHVSLKVYDVIGNEVAVLVNEFKSTGTYKVEFDGSRLASGVYFYRLQAGNFNSVKKLVLMK